MVGTKINSQLLIRPNRIQVNLCSKFRLVYKTLFRSMRNVVNRTRKESPLVNFNIKIKYTRYLNIHQFYQQNIYV